MPDAELRAELVGLLDALDGWPQPRRRTGGIRTASATSTSIPPTCWSGPTGWVVIDWLTVAAGPSAADLARTLVLWGQRSTGPLGDFLRAVRREGRGRAGLDDDVLDAWVRVVAAARVAEGFEGAERAWLLRVAGGAERLFA